MPDEHYASVWESIADTTPSRIAIVESGRSITWRDYEDLASRLAAGLRRLGLRPGDRVAVALPNTIEHAAMVWGCLKTGVRPINVNPRYTATECLDLVRSVEARALVCSPDLITTHEERALEFDGCRVVAAEGNGHDQRQSLTLTNLIAESPEPRRLRSPHEEYLFYTGGTTGSPKAVVYEIKDHVAYFRELMADVHRDRGSLGGQAPAVVMPLSPLGHAGGLWAGVMGPHLLGLTVALRESTHFDAHECIEASAKLGVTSWMLVGDAFARPIIEALRGMPREQHPELRSIVSSGAALSYGAKVDLLSFFPDLEIHEIFAATEGGFGRSVASAGRVPETGEFSADTRTALFHEAPDGTYVGDSSASVGLVGTSSLVPKGYLGSDGLETARVTTWKGERWSVLGDVARHLGGGRYQFLGRADRVINVGGEKVSPEEVEAELVRLAGIEDCAVLPVSHARFGSSIAALLVGGQVTDDEIREVLASRLAGFKVPRQFIRVEQIPRTTVGKLDMAGCDSVLQRWLSGRAAQ